MVIVFTINEVFRDFLNQIEKSMVKYGHVDEDYVLPDEQKVHHDLYTRFNLITVEEIDKFNEFVYDVGVLPCFGYADLVHKQSVLGFNNIMSYIEDYYGNDVEIILAEKGIHNDMSATLFFLSKTACRARNIKFHKNIEEVLDYADVIVTANPNIIKNKKENTIIIKIKSDYNNECVGDYEFDNVFELSKNNELIDTLINEN